MVARRIAFLGPLVALACSSGGGETGGGAGAAGEVSVGGAGGASGSCYSKCVAATGDSAACVVACGRGAGGAGGAVDGGIGSGATAGAGAASGSGPGDGGAPGGAGGAAGDASGSGGAGAGRPPGSGCVCDGDCAGDAAHPAVCVTGICMTRATGPCAGGGSKGECGVGSRCWELKNGPGVWLCWPDCGSSSCDGTCDGDGSCVPSRGGTCDPSCGSHCPSGAAPCSPTTPGGFCATAGEVCAAGTCVVPCSAAVPTGWCPAGSACQAGGCVSTGGCPTWECSGPECGDLVQVPGSFDPTSPEARAAGYFKDAKEKYSFLQRSLALVVAHAACETAARFPGTNPIGLLDLSQADGLTPGTDVGSPRHPTTTHRGRDLDIAYYQTDGLNDGQIVCGDGSDTNGNGSPGKYNDGYFCTTDQNIVDWPRQAYFFAKMAVTGRVRVFGVDRTLDDDFQIHLDALFANGEISRGEHDRALRLGTGSAGGWQYHHHHVHLSYCPIGTTGPGCTAGLEVPWSIKARGEEPPARVLSILPPPFDGQAPLRHPLIPCEHD